MIGSPSSDDWKPKPQVLMVGSKLEFSWMEANGLYRGSFSDQPPGGWRPATRGSRSSTRVSRHLLRAQDNLQRAQDHLQGAQDHLQGAHDHLKGLKITFKGLISPNKGLKTSFKGHKISFKGQDQLQGAQAQLQGTQDQVQKSQGAQEHHFMHFLIVNTCSIKVAVNMSRNSLQSLTCLFFSLFFLESCSLNLSIPLGCMESDMETILKTSFDSGSPKLPELKKFLIQANYLEEPPRFRQTIWKNLHDSGKLSRRTSTIQANYLEEPRGFRQTLPESKGVDDSGSFFEKNCLNRKASLR